VCVYVEDLSHDAVLAASMLLVVVGTTINTSPSHPASDLSASVTRWLGWAEQRPSCMLCLLHALLAKLSPQILTRVVFQEEPLLLAMFSVLCQLCDR